MRGFLLQNVQESTREGDDLIYSRIYRYCQELSPVPYQLARNGQQANARLNGNQEIGSHVELYLIVSHVKLLKRSLYVVVWT